ncbi:hypothetical protein AB0A73_21615 [Glycomyces sp. NPDC047369]
MSTLFNDPDFHRGGDRSRKPRRRLKRWFREHPKRAWTTTAGVLTGITLLLTAVNLTFSAVNEIRKMTESDRGTSAEAPSPVFDGTFAPLDDPASALGVTLVEVRPTYDQIVVTPESGMTEAFVEAYASEAAWHEGFDDLAAISMETAGAAAKGALTARITLSTTTDRTFTVYDIRAEPVEPLPPVDGYVMAPDWGGSSVTDKMAYILNAPDPGPFVGSEDESIGYLEGQDFFGPQLIEVTKEDKQNIDLTYHVADGYPMGSYEFSIAIDIEVEGKFFTSLIDNHGVPFRVTAQDECEYDAVYVPDAEDAVWDMHVISPQDFGWSCG